MPRIADPSKKPDYIETLRLLKKFKEAWYFTLETTTMDPVKHSQLGIVALCQLAAVVAVDVGMPVEAFIKVCSANHQEAFTRAPKFGE